jgi:hypothetical protein
MQWTGLEGRRLGDYAGDWNMGPDGRPCRQPVVTSELTVEIQSIRAALGDLVDKLTAPLYAAFDFGEVRRDRIESEIRRMLRRA